MTFRDPFAEGEWYHCYNRGVDKRAIFKARTDYERFQMLLYVSNSSKRIHLSDFGDGKRQGLTLPLVLEVGRGEQLIEIGAYALMPNHFHLLIKAKNPKEASLFMQKVTTGYTMYFNKKYERSGALFQGTFKSKRVENDIYFKRLLSYIHANPAELYEPGWKHGRIENEKDIKTKLSRYSFSSLPDYLESNRAESKLLSIDSVLQIIEYSLSIDRIFEEAKSFAV